MMKFVNRRDTMAGLLILLGLVVGILSIAPAVDSEDFLINVVVDPIGVQLSALFQFILFYAVSCRFILPYSNLFHFIPFYSILFHFI